MRDSYLGSLGRATGSRGGTSPPGLGHSAGWAHAGSLDEVVVKTIECADTAREIYHQTFASGAGIVRLAAERVSSVVRR
jgi:hypothetical protein